jgi:hypothetical protein
MVRDVLKVVWSGLEEVVRKLAEGNCQLEMVSRMVVTDLLQGLNTLLRLGRLACFLVAAVP